MKNSMNLKTEEDLKIFLLEALKNKRFNKITMFYHRRVVWHDQDQHWYFIVFDNDILGMFRHRNKIFEDFLKCIGLCDNDISQIIEAIHLLDADSVIGLINYYM